MLCACGICGQEVKEGNRYINGHNNKGKTKENEESIKRMSEKLTGRTKENDEGRRIQAEKLTGRSKEENLRFDMLNGRAEYLNSFPRNPEKIKKKSEKDRYRMKNGGAVYASSFVTKEGRRNQAEKVSGEKSHFWKGGISFEFYGLEFNNDLKKLIRERDNYVCQLCGEKGKYVHHIDYNKRNNSTDNLITLCKSCHSKTTLRRLEFQPFLELYMIGKYGETF